MTGFGEKKTSGNLGGRAQCSTVAVDRNRVYAAGLQEEVYTLGHHDDDLVFRGSRGEDGNAAFVREGALSDSSPVLWDDDGNEFLFVGDGAGTLHKFSVGNDLLPATEPDSSPNYFDPLFDVDSAITSTPVVDGDLGLVYFGTNDGTVYAVDADLGLEEWRVSVDAPVYSDLAVSLPLFQEESVFLTPNDGRVLAFDAKDGVVDGEPVWEYDTETTLGVSSPVTFHSGGSSGFSGLAVAADEAYIFHESGTVVFNSGEDTDTPFGGTAGACPIVHTGENWIYAGSSDGRFYVYDYADQTIVGEGPVEIGGGSPIQSMTVFDDDTDLVIAQLDGTLTLLDTNWVDTGDDPVLETTDLGSATRSSPVVHDDVVYIGTESGEVVSVELVED